MVLECVDMRLRDIGRQFIGIEANDYFFPFAKSRIEKGYGG